MWQVEALRELVESATRTATGKADLVEEGLRGMVPKQVLQRTRDCVRQVRELLSERRRCMIRIDDLENAHTELKSAESENMQLMLALDQMVPRSEYEAVLATVRERDWALEALTKRAEDMVPTSQLDDARLETDKSAREVSRLQQEVRNLAERAAQMEDQMTKMIPKTQVEQHAVAVSLDLMCEYEVTCKSRASTQAFDTQLQSEIASSLGIPSSSVVVLCHQRGSVIAEVALCPQLGASRKTPGELAAELVEQANDADSQLRQGTVGRHARRAEIHGVVAMAVCDSLLASKRTVWERVESLSSRLQDMVPADALDACQQELVRSKLDFSRFSRKLSQDLVADLDAAMEQNEHLLLELHRVRSGIAEMVPGSLLDAFHEDLLASCRRTSLLHQKIADCVKVNRFAVEGSARSVSTLLCEAQDLLSSIVASLAQESCAADDARSVVLPLKDRSSKVCRGGPMDDDTVVDSAVSAAQQTDAKSQILRIKAIFEHPLDEIRSDIVQLKDEMMKMSDDCLYSDGLFQESQDEVQRLAAEVERLRWIEAECIERMVPRNQLEEVVAELAGRQREIDSLERRLEGSVLTEEAALLRESVATAMWQVEALRELVESATRMATGKADLVEDLVRGMVPKQLLMKVLDRQAALERASVKERIHLMVQEENVQMAHAELTSAISKMGEVMISMEQMVSNSEYETLLEMIKDRDLRLSAGTRKVDTSAMGALSAESSSDYESIPDEIEGGDWHEQTSQFQHSPNCTLLVRQFEDFVSAANAFMADLGLFLWTFEQEGGCFKSPQLKTSETRRAQPSRNSVSLPDVEEIAVSKTASKALDPVNLDELTAGFVPEQLYEEAGGLVLENSELIEVPEIQIRSMVSAQQHTAMQETIAKSIWDIERCVKEICQAVDEAAALRASMSVEIDESEHLEMLNELRRLLTEMERIEADCVHRLDCVGNVQGNADFETVYEWGKETDCCSPRVEPVGLLSGKKDCLDQRNAGILPSCESLLSAHWTIYECLEVLKRRIRTTVPKRELDACREDLACAREEAALLFSFLRPFLSPDEIGFVFIDGQATAVDLELLRIRVSEMSMSAAFERVMAEPSRELLDHSNMSTLLRELIEEIDETKMLMEMTTASVFAITDQLLSPFKIVSRDCETSLVHMVDRMDGVLQRRSLETTEGASERAEWMRATVTKGMHEEILPQAQDRVLSVAPRAWMVEVVDPKTAIIPVIHLEKSGPAEDRSLSRGWQVGASCDAANASSAEFRDDLQNDKLQAASAKCQDYDALGYAFTEISHLKSSLVEMIPTERLNEYPVAVGIRLDYEIEAIFQQKSAMQAFDSELQADIASALDISMASVFVLGYQRGSVVAEVALSPVHGLCTGTVVRTPSSLAADLAQQASDPDSALRRGTVGRLALHAEVHGLVGMPVCTALVASHHTICSCFEGWREHLRRDFQMGRDQLQEERAEAASALHASVGDVDRAIEQNRLLALELERCRVGLAGMVPRACLDSAEDEAQRLAVEADMLRLRMSRMLSIEDGAAIEGLVRRVVCEVEVTQELLQRAMTLTVSKADLLFAALGSVVSREELALALDEAGQHFEEHLSRMVPRDTFDANIAELAALQSTLKQKSVGDSRLANIEKDSERGPGQLEETLEEVERLRNTVAEMRASIDAMVPRPDFEAVFGEICRRDAEIAELREQVSCMVPKELLAGAQPDSAAAFREMELLQTRLEMCKSASQPAALWDRRVAVALHLEQDVNSFGVDDDFACDVNMQEDVAAALNVPPDTVAVLWCDVASGCAEVALSVARDIVEKDKILMPEILAAELVRQAHTADSLLRQGSAGVMVRGAETHGPVGVQFCNTLLAYRRATHGAFEVLRGRLRETIPMHEVDVCMGELKRANEEITRLWAVIGNMVYRAELDDALERNQHLLRELDGLRRTFAESVPREQLEAADAEVLRCTLDLEALRRLLADAVPLREITELRAEVYGMICDVQGAKLLLETAATSAFSKVAILTEELQNANITPEPELRPRTPQSESTVREDKVDQSGTEKSAEVTLMAMQGDNSERVGEADANTTPDKHLDGSLYDVGQGSLSTDGRSAKENVAMIVALFFDAGSDTLLGLGSSAVCAVIMQVICAALGASPAAIMVLCLNLKGVATVALLPAGAASPTAMAEELTRQAIDEYSFLNQGPIRSLIHKVEVLGPVMTQICDTVAQAHCELWSLLEEALEQRKSAGTAGALELEENRERTRTAEAKAVRLGELFDSVAPIVQLDAALDGSQDHFSTSGGSRAWTMESRFSDKSAYIDGSPPYPRATVGGSVLGNEEEAAFSAGTAALIASVTRGVERTQRLLNQLAAKWSGGSSAAADWDGGIYRQPIANAVTWTSSTAAMLDETTGLRAGTSRKPPCASEKQGSTAAGQGAWFWMPEATAAGFRVDGDCNSDYSLSCPLSLLATWLRIGRQEEEEGSGRGIGEEERLSLSKALRPPMISSRCQKLLSGPTQVTVFCPDAEVVIYYTLDGSPPDPTNFTGCGPSPLRVLLSKPAVLRTVSCRGNECSSVTADEFVVCGGQDATLWVGATQAIHSASSSPATRRCAPTKGVGVGMLIQRYPDTGQVVVMKLIEGGPAHADGRVMAGDLLLRVDGAETRLLTSSDILRRISGAEGTRVELTFKRGEPRCPGGRRETYCVSLRRSSARVSSPPR